MIRILVDGVALQRGVAYAPHWPVIIARLAQKPALRLLLMDRGGGPTLDSATALPFPAHTGREGAADSLLIQQLCDEFAIDVFVSTGSTSPVTAPSVLLVHSPELLDAADPEAQACLTFAQRYVCTSRSLLSRLRTRCPEVPASHVAVCSDDAEAIAAGLEAAAHALCAEAQGGAYDRFFREWKRVREIQAAVDWHARVSPPKFRTRTRPASAKRNIEVTAVLTSGYEHSGCKLVHDILVDAGLVEALPSRREQVSVCELQARAVRSEASSTPKTIAALRPAGLWQELAIDLFLGNMDGPAWGWSHSDTVPLLDFWHEFDASTRFVLVYSPLEFAIGQALQGQDMTGGALELVTNQWDLYGKAILQFFKRNQGRCELLNVVGVLHAPGQCVRRLAHRWSLPLLLSNDYIARRDRVSAVSASLARGAVRNRDDLVSLYAELEMLAAIDGVEASAAEELEAWKQYNTERIDHAAAVRQKGLLESDLTECAGTKNALQDLLGQNKQQIEQLAGARDADAQRVIELEQTLRQSEQRTEWLLSECDAHAAQLGDLHDALERNAEQTRRLDEQLSARAGLVDELQRESRQRQQRVEQLTGERDSLAALVTELKAELSQNAQQAETLRSMHDVHAAVIAELQNALRKNEERLEQIVGERDTQAWLANERLAQIEGLEEQLASTRELPTPVRAAADETNLRELRRENELHLLHLQQVQEELEHLYIQNQELIKRGGELQALSYARQFWQENQPNEVIVDLRREINGSNWYEAEEDGRWVGPGKISRLQIPALMPGRYALALHVVDAMTSAVLEGTRLSLNGTPIDLHIPPGEGFPTVVSGEFSAGAADADESWQFEFRFNELMSPSERGESDHRTLAIRVKALELILTAPEMSSV